MDGTVLRGSVAKVSFGDGNGLESGGNQSARSVNAAQHDALECVTTNSIVNPLPV
jgi:hypothetical protein